MNRARWRREERVGCDSLASCCRPDMHCINGIICHTTLVPPTSNIPNQALTILLSLSLSHSQHQLHPCAIFQQTLYTSYIIPHLSSIMKYLRVHPLSSHYHHYILEQTFLQQKFTSRRTTVTLFENSPLIFQFTASRLLFLIQKIIISFHFFTYSKKLISILYRSDNLQKIAKFESIVISFRALLLPTWVLEYQFQ